MQVYLVGGAVRDRLLGREVSERDWVVVGATPGELERSGFIPVGRDFPVFLHPKTKEEHALARLERKVAPGYRGFASVIGGKRQCSITPELCEKMLKVSNSGLYVLQCIRAIGNPIPSCGLGHQLHRTHRAFRRNRVDIETRLHFHDGAHQRRVNLVAQGDAINQRI